MAFSLWGITRPIKKLTSFLFASLMYTVGTRFRVVFVAVILKF